MTNQTQSCEVGEKCVPKVSIGDLSKTLVATSKAVANRAYQISQRRGRWPGPDREDLLLAEKDVLRPLSCYGSVDSIDKAVFSVFFGAMGTKDLVQIEVCAEPDRLIFVGTKRAFSKSAAGEKIYRVVSLEGEFDPSSMCLRQEGPIVHITMHRLAQKSAA